MYKNAAKGKDEVSSANADQGCFHTEHRIVGNSKKLVYELHYIFIALLRTKLKLVCK